MLGPQMGAERPISVDGRMQMPEERQSLLLAKESGLYLVAKEQECGKIKTQGYLK